jgi:hypothetical protein
VGEASDEAEGESSGSESEEESGSASACSLRLSMRDRLIMSSSLRRGVAWPWWADVEGRRNMVVEAIIDLVKCKLTALGCYAGSKRRSYRYKDDLWGAEVLAWMYAW